VNGKNAVSLTDNPDTEDTCIQDNGYYSKSSTNANVAVIDHFQLPETSPQPHLSEIGPIV